MHQILAILLLSLGYLVRGRTKDILGTTAGRVAWALACMEAAFLCHFSWYQAIGFGLCAFAANMISHGYWYAMGDYTGNTDGRWMPINNLSYWPCFLAMAIIGLLRGAIMGLPLLCWWMPLAFLVLHPLAYSIGKWTKWQPIPVSEAIFGAVVGISLVLA